MKFDINNIKEKVINILKQHNLELYEITEEFEFEQDILRVAIDSPQGITLDHLEIVNKELGDYLDTLESLDFEYMLEVCSAGAEKELRTEEAINNSIDKYVCLVNTDGEEVLGYLLENNLDSYKLKVNEKGRIRKLDYSKNDIKTIRLAVKF